MRLHGFRIDLPFNGRFFIDLLKGDWGGGILLHTEHLLGVKAEGAV